MELMIELDLDSDALHDYDGEVDPNCIAQVLGGLSKQLEGMEDLETGWDQPIKDDEGNIVGTVRIDY